MATYPFLSSSCPIKSNVGFSARSSAASGSSSGSGGTCRRRIGGSSVQSRIRKSRKAGLRNWQCDKNSAFVSGVSAVMLVGPRCTMRSPSSSTSNEMCGQDREVGVFAGVHDAPASPRKLLGHVLIGVLIPTFFTEKVVPGRDRCPLSSYVLVLQVGIY